MTNYTVDCCACNAGVTLSADNDTNPRPHHSSTTTTTPKTSTGTTETLSTTTVAPRKDIWTVSNPVTDTICILLSANISVTYNDSSEVI